MQARETYTYGNDRASYLNNQTGDSYQYLTNQSGSVTGLTKDGQAVASSSYHPYGSTKATTDETGNPFAYNGEARDVTGLDYLRARYYDSQVGTFLTEDSYSGELTDPLSQNLYSYVQNNPVNYTDPSGHRKMGLNVPRRRIINTRNQRKYSQMRVDPALAGHSGIGGGGYLSAANHIRHRVQSNPSYRPPASYYAAFGPHAAVHRPSPSYVGGYYGGGSASHYTAYQQKQAQARAIAQRQQNIRNAYAQATGIKGTPRSKEAQNLYLNWGSAFAATLRHVCNPKTAKGKDGGQNKKPKISVGQFREIEEATRHGLTVDQKKRIDKMTLEEYLKAPPMTAEENTYASRAKFKSFNQLQRSTVLPALAGELSGWNNARRVWTGKDPITGKKANRWLAGGELVIDLLTSIVPVAKAGKIAKVAKAAEAVDDASDVAKAAKAVDKVDDVSDITKAGMGVGNPVPILGKGSTGRVVANTLEEQLAMKEVMSNPLANAFEVPINMTDSRWLGTEGWVKMQRVVTLSNGTKINIHYVYNKITGVFDDFKFK